MGGQPKCKDSKKTLIFQEFEKLTFFLVVSGQWLRTMYVSVILNEVKDPFSTVTEQFRMDPSLRSGWH